MRGSRKIGIVSLYSGQNFGNKLQNYAVEQLIAKAGFEPVTFTYEIPVNVRRTPKIARLKPSYWIAYAKLRLSRYVPTNNTDVSYLKKFLWYRKQRSICKQAEVERKVNYQKFDDELLHFSERMIPLTEESRAWTQEYYKFVCGSDQVWNPHYLSTSELCFLQFAPENKRIALSPSFGVSEIPGHRREEFALWLNEFSALSVREDAGAKIIKELTGREAPVLPDPTMCISREDWEDMERIPETKLPDKYILTYFLGARTKQYQRYIRDISEKMGLPVIDLFDLMRPEWFSVAPREFVYCVHHAEAVFTDSFHACVFSILFQKPFLAFDRVEGGHSMSARIVTLLHTFGMEKNKYYKGTDFDCFQTDFTDISERLEKQRGLMKDYLRENL